MNTSSVSSVEVDLQNFRGQLLHAAQRQLHARRRRRGAAVLVFALLLFAGGAIAANTLLFSQHDLTQADVERQATVVTNDHWLNCTGGRCKPESGSHRQVAILPSMGVTFVLPDGSPVTIVPTFGLLPLPTHLNDTRSQFGLPGLDASGHRTQGTVEIDHEIDHTGGSWMATLPDGRVRTVRWVNATGSLTVADRLPDGKQQITTYHPGDVVPLVPDSIDAAARTLDKAVTFDLPDMGRVSIFPTFNETYVDGPALGSAAPPTQPAVPSPGLDPTYGERYGLTPTPQGVLLPVSAQGGEWRVVLPDGTQRTISWQKADASVFVTDTRTDGVEHRVDVPIGHELPLVPFG